MEIVNANQISGDSDQGWVFLSEISLEEFINVGEKGDVRNPGWLFQSIMGLGIPPDCFKTMECRLEEFTNQVLVRFHQGGLKLPIMIRLFCQKKAVKGKNSARISNDLNLEQTGEYQQKTHPTDPRTTAGWGYFLIEKSEGSLADSSASPHHFIDLYFYNEGA